MTELFEWFIEIWRFWRNGAIRDRDGFGPCRLDMGGTLDISTFIFPYGRFRPLTVNLAINLRTQVRLSHTPLALSR